MATIEIRDDNFDAEVLQSDTPVLVDFWAEWCGPCRMLAPVIEAVSESFAGQLKVGKLDTDAHPSRAQQHQITGIPCCILFKNGEEVARIVGYKAQDAFEEEIKPHL